MRPPITALLSILMIAAALGAGRAQTPVPTYPVPLFRSVDSKAKPPEPIKGSLRLLVDDNFPPFHYRDDDGRLTGMNIDIASAVCSELKVRCETKVVPFNDLLPALQRGEGDVIISAMRLNPETLAKADVTRPFYRALGRFAALNGNTVSAADPVTLAGKRIAAASGSTHEAWLKRYYPNSQVIPLAVSSDVQTALQTGNVDLVFDDAIRLIYWIRGEVSRACCKFIDGAFVDPAYFSQPLSFLVRRGRSDNLVQAFDWGLDRLQSSGRFAPIFRRYVPLDPWASASASPPTASSNTP